MAKQESGTSQASLHKAKASADLVVGIGASAGGMEAVRSLLLQTPRRSGLALVLVQHLDTGGQETLIDALKEISPVPLVEIGDGMPLTPDTLFIAPARSHVSLQDNHFRLQPAGHDRRKPSAIDHFFHSLAGQAATRAVGIILSGAGTDGTLGLKAISDAGGMTIAQSPQTAKFDSMPRSAATTGVADHILPPNQMPAELDAYRKHLDRSRGESEKELRESIIEAIPKVAKILQDATEHDFRHYKPSTLTRRIQRRMQLLKLSAIDEYLDILKRQEEESRKLFCELLIGVTEFFRDKDSFAFMQEQVVPKLFHKRKREDTVRIWSAGCSTGEEAYSLAMLVREHLDKLEDPPQVRIFATDIDERALDIARQGFYPQGIAEDVSAERLKRFFVKRGNRYQVSKEIRELCVFSVHNLISDPPFSRQDLISCRNLLIYLGAHLQKKIIPLFHYALRPNGFLFLGPSEGMEAHRDLFQQLHAKHRISQRKSSAIAAPAQAARGASYGAAHATPPPASEQPDLPRLMQRIVLDEFAPKTVVVNGEGTILCASGDLSEFLALANGAFQNNVVKMARPGLRVGLRAAMREAKVKKRQTTDDSVSLRVSGGIQQVMLTVQPMPEMGEDSGLYLVVFQKVGLPYRKGQKRAAADPSEENDSLVDQLERELHETREELERTIQDLEAANEELKSSNEELLSMNEELQSTNEEMETSKEEVQIVNQSLAKANDDLQNLLSSTRIATLFLDSEGRIRNFTPAITEIYRLIATDIGRPLADLNSNAEAMPPLPAAKELLEVGQVEHEVRTRDDQWYIRRVSPYHSSSDNEEGLVVTFTKVTRLKKLTASLESSERALRESQERINYILASAQVGTWSWIKANDEVRWSDNLEEIHGRTMGSFDGTFDGVFQDAHPADKERVLQVLRSSLEKRSPYRVQYRVVLPDHSIRWLEADGQGVYDQQGELISVSGLCRDITERKLSEQRLLAEHAVSHIVAEGIDLETAAPRLLETFARHLDLDACEIWLPSDDGGTLRIAASHLKNASSDALTSFEKAGRALRLANGELMPGRCWESGQAIWALERQISSLARSSEAKQAGFRSAVCFPIIAAQKTIGVFAFYARQRIPETDELSKMLKAIGLDLGQLAQSARAAAALRASEARFRNLANAVPVLVWTAGTDGQCNFFNKHWLEFTGRTFEEEKGEGWLQGVHPEDHDRCRTTFGEAFETQERFQMEYRLMRHDGQYRWMIGEGAPMFGADDAFVGLIGGCIDITDSKETEFALRQASDQRRLALQAADIGLWDWDLVADSVFLDERCRALLGLPGDLPVDSRTALDKIHPHDRPALEAKLADAIDPSSSGSLAIEYRVGESDRGARWLAVLGEVSFDGEGSSRRAVRFVGTLQDITERKRSEQALRDHARTLEIINDVNLQLAGELELDVLVQSVTDAGRMLSGAQFGAFFYNKVSEAGESFLLYSFSGAHREAFERLPMPRNTEVFDTTFSGAGVSISDDITADPRYGKMPPFNGLPPGHPPVRSYLSVPVIGRDGQPVGGLFYGHLEAGAFTEQHASILRGVAAQAAVAIGNARLYAAQRESEQRYRHLLQTGHDAVYLYPLHEDGEPGRFIDVNEQATQQLGYTREEFLQMTPDDLISLPLEKRREIYIRLKAERSMIVQSRHRKKDGGHLRAEVSATLIELDGGTYVISKARDIADRLMVEEELRRSERLYRGIGESMNYGIWICDAQGRNTYTSESLKRLTGMTQEECSAFGWGKVLHPDEAEATIEAWKVCAQNADFWEREHRMLGVDGKYHHILARGVPIRDEDGSIVQWAGINLDIDYLKQTEKALRESEERFKTYFESSPTPLWEKDLSAVKAEVDKVAAEHSDLEQALLDNPEMARRCLLKTRIIDANSATAELFRASNREEMIEKGDQVVANNRAPSTMATLLSAMQKGESRIRLEEEITTFDGEKRFVLTELVALPGHEATFGRVLISRVDITDRKRAEQAAALTAAVGSEMSSDLVYDNTLAKLAQTVVPTFADWCAVDLVEADGSLRRIALSHADPAKEELALELQARFGPVVDKRAGVGKVLQTRQPDACSDLPQELLQAIATDAEHLKLLQDFGLRSYICVPLVARDAVLGAITFATAESGRRYDQQDVAVAGEIARHASQAIDNAKLYQLQINALREAQEAQSLLDTIIATAPVGVALLDRELRFAQVNNVMAEINGKSPEEHLGLSLEQVLPELWPKIEPLCRELLAGSNTTSRLEFRPSYDDGTSERSFVYTFYPIRSADGKIAGIGTLVEEITERKRFEETLARARQQAEAANQSKSEFLANMSHEIRTPMTSILGYSDILRQNLEDPDDIQCVNTIRRNGEFLLEIINDILDLSRIEAGQLEVNLERSQPDAIIADVVSLMEVRAREKQLDLQVEFQGEVPDTIETDPVRLRQILVNLLGNAVKFTNKGAVRLAVDFVPESELMRCKVIDTGIGMTSEQLERIFQPFKQADTSVSRRFGGSGLGLTICDRLVQMLGGTIRASSKPDEGSVFTFTVRTGSLAGIPMVAPRSALTPSPTPVAGKPISLHCRALVVDDRREIRQLAQHYIEEAGGKAVVAENGEECLEAVGRAVREGHPFDIVVIDMQMPVMDGYEATRRLRAAGFAKPIIALTAHAMKGDREKSLTVGCNDYATKPIDQAAFIELLARHTRAESDSRGQQGKPQPQSKSERSRRLLIVEDNVSLRRVLAITFEKRGHDVRVAPNGEVALEIARAFRPQVALLDLGLPDMSGLELVGHLRRLPEMEGARIFALSGRDDPQDIQKSREAGFDRHIGKPPDVDALERLFFESLAE